jgi:ATP-dependent Zn protease
VHKITIMPRGRALGYTMVLPDDAQPDAQPTRLHARRPRGGGVDLP